MKVYGQGGELITESPTREPEEAARLALAQLATQPTDLARDASNLAPVSLELECVRRYSTSGSLAQVSRDMGIAIYELQKLQRTQWWQDELAALRREETAIKNARLTRIHNLTLEQLEDRLEHGDLIARGRGFVRQKLSGRDLSRISEAIFKQRQLLNGDPTDIKGFERISNLADKLRALGSKDKASAARIIEAEAIDVTPTRIEGPGPAPSRVSEVEPREVESTVTGDA